MSSLLRRQLRIWSVWILVVSATAMANPWGELGWIELSATLAPMLLLVDRRITREAALSLGLPALTLMWLFEPGSTALVRLLAAWAVFSTGVMLAARAIRSQIELEAIAGQVAFVPTEADAGREFWLALERELGRARRHERCFAVLSVAAHPHSLEADASGLFRSDLLRTLAENRACFELRDLLRTELHVYSDVAAIGSRVLALVPEIDEDTLAVLLERLGNAADERFDFDVQLGAGCFPRDAVCAEDLIEVADRNRTTSKLRSLPERVAAREPSMSGWRSPDVQG